MTNIRGHEGLWLIRIVVTNLTWLVLVVNNILNTNILILCTGLLKAPLDPGYSLSLDPVPGSWPQRDAPPQYHLRHDRNCWYNWQWLYHPHMAKVHIESRCMREHFTLFLKLSFFPVVKTTNETKRMCTELKKYRK